MRFDFLLLSLLAFITAWLSSAPADAAIVINEFLARNDRSITDGDGQSSDWIELYNNGTTAETLDGYKLTDDPDNVEVTALLSATIPAGEYLVVFASGRSEMDGAGNVHVPFNLSGTGEYLALLAPDGEKTSEFSPAYPKQFTDISYGITGGSAAFFPEPTPGAANTTISFSGIVEDTVFSVDRGLYDAPFDVEISTSTDGATIYYTTDGSEPSASNGTAYSAAIQITTTTALRAVAVKEGFRSTNIDTHTYIFINDVIHQPASIEGYPETWGTDSEVNTGPVVADYEMDPEVVNDATQTYSVAEALRDIPSMSVTLDPDDFLGPRNGIYSHPRSTGAAWEKACSVELIQPDGTKGFQENCALLIHGGSSRRPFRMQKHSFRLEFSSEYGASKLRFPLVPESKVEEFNKIVLRACFTDSWGLASWDPGRYRPDDSQYIRDVWMKESMLEMGHLAGQGTFVHLYINGLYWGLYNPSERMDSSFYSDHLGGEREDWDVIHDFNELRSGSKAAWNKLHSAVRNVEDITEYLALQGLNPDGTPNPELDNLIDIDNFIDYMLLHFHARAEDWPNHNWYAARKSRNANEGFIFQPWDQEIVLDNLSLNRLSSRDAGTPAALFQNLRDSDEFRLRFADRAHKHLHNDGALSLANSRALYRRLADRIDKAIVAESARWGDTADTTPWGNRPSKPLYTRDADWVVERDVVLDEFLPDLHDETDSRATISRLRSADLYPNTEAPAFSQHGGFVGSDFRLEMSAGAGTIYFTTDGSDPRARPATASFSTIFEEGTAATAFVPTDDSLGSSWQTSGFDDSSWISGTTGVGFEGVPGDYKDIIQLPITGMQGVNASAYIRIPFQVDTPGALSGLQLSMKYDDGFVAYLNGVQVASANVPGTVAWDSRAIGNHPDSDAVVFEPFDISAHVDKLVTGENILAIQGMNSSPGSSDYMISAKLEGVTISTDVFSPTASAYTGPVGLPIAATVKARALSGEEWSPLTVATFLQGTPASAQNLTISEIMYNPAGSDDSEFIEVANITTTNTVHLTGVTFSRGIDFDFPNGLFLAPGQAVLVVKDRAAFMAAYPGVNESLIVGEFANGTGLSNSGETLALTAADGTLMREITYSDSEPWPTSADGEGSSLELNQPFANSDPSLVTNWQTAPVAGGSPGMTERQPFTGFTGDPAADQDGDGIQALIEYATGRSDEVSDLPDMPFTARVEMLDIDGIPQSYLTFSVVRDNTRQDVTLQAELSTDLSTWSSDSVVLHSESIGDVHDNLLYRSSLPVSDESAAYFRLKATLK
ncbi:MAG: lamin tail domain-containing protein [Verrucomicrobiales bacterium]